MNIDSYLSDIEHRLKEHVPDERRDEIIRELRSHLWMSRNGAIEELEMPEEQAELTAMNLMGSPQLLAEDIVRRETGIESKSIWRMAVAPGVALVVSHLAPWFMYGTPPMDGLLLLMSYAVLALLAVAAWKSRKWLIGPMAAWLCATFILGTAAHFIITPLRVTALPKEVAVQGLRLKITEAEQALAGNMAATQTQGQYRYPWFQSSTNVLHLPYVPIALPMRSGVQYVQSLTPNLEQAKAAWQKTGPVYLAAMKQNLSEVEASYEDWLASRPGASMDMWLLRLMASFSFEICVFTVVNGSTLLLLNRRRRRKSQTGRAIA